MYKSVPTWDNDHWTHTKFETLEEFRDFLVPIFKEPGQYEFDSTALLFNEQARIYNQKKGYCDHPLGTRDFIKYWDDQKDKCRNGVIFKSGEKVWYVTRDYYHWINFLPIYDKVKGKYGFPEVWDSQYHMALYETLAELHYKHSAVLKKRQFGSSYFHCAKLINQQWFEEGPVMKMGGSHKDYVNQKGSWKFLEEYRSFMNEHTAWYRPMNPSSTGMWQQQIEISKGNRKSMKGNKGVIQSLTFDKDPTNGVGGNIKYFFYEEAGIAPTMDQTTEYLYPAMRSGHIYTGMFIAAGSVGDLDQCEPLKQMILYPDANEIYSVKSNLVDDKGTEGFTGLFIPEQWSMPPYIDEYGNSLVEDALKAILEKRTKEKKELTPEKYQIRVSQSPTNISEAFAYRKAAIFPTHLVTAQLKRIEENSYPVEHLDIERDSTGKVKVEPSNKLPIRQFPIISNTEDKQGVLCVYERPVSSPEFGLYYASIDPVGEGKTTTSESLTAIYVYKRAVEVQRVEAGESKFYVEQYKIVASWCGRYDTIEDTNAMLEMIVEWYNAWTIVENNVTSFITHMKNRKKTRYLATKDQMLFLKEAQANQNVHQDYGWRNAGNVFKQHMLDYGIEYIKEEIDTVTAEDGTILKVVYGIERIPDPMLLKEMLAYQPGLNVDRIVAYCALVAFAKLQQAHRGLPKRVEDVDKSLKKSNNLFKLSKSPFTHIGKNVSSRLMQKNNRNPFHNIK